MNRLLPTRRLVPRWRKAAFAVRQPDMLGLVKPVQQKVLTTSEELLQDALAAWSVDERIGDLADVLAFGIDRSLHELLLEPAKAAMLHPFSTPAMKLVAGEILKVGSSEAEVWSPSTNVLEVRKLRALLRDTPNDVVALVDIAQHHLACGKERAAYRALATAMQMSPKSAFVIRAVTRYWVHLNRPDRAHAFIKSQSASSTDPWLMAAEIAIAQVANEPSSQLKKAQRALAMESFRPTDSSELAGAVGGTELWHGNVKEARKLFRTALAHPNDNVLAQAVTNQDFLGIDVDEQVMRRAPNGVFEVRALRAMISGDFSAAAQFTEAWAQEEPFSSRPRLLQSYVCGALGEYEAALLAADTGLLSDPHDRTLRGNRAYALVAAGRFAEAQAELKLLESRDDLGQRPFTVATRGMYLLLTGHADTGLQMYEAALADLEKAKLDEQVTTCLAFMARSARVAGVKEATAILNRATDRFKKFPSQAAAVILRTLQQDVANIDAAPLRKVVQWEWDPSSNTITEKRELSKKGASGFSVSTKKGPGQGRR